MNRPTRTHIADNFFAAYSWFQRTDPAFEVYDAGALACFYAPNGMVDFNIAMSHPEMTPPDPASAAFKEALAPARAFFAARRSPFSCWVPQGPAPVPGANDLGFAARIDYMGQCLDLPTADLTPPAQNSIALNIRRVSHEAELLALADLVAAGWSVPAGPYRTFFTGQAQRLLHPDCPKHYYIGWADEAPACCMELFTQPEQGIAGIYYVTTHNAFRRQGHATRLQNHVLAQARQTGYHTAVVVSEPDERRLLARRGFIDCDQWYEYVHNA